MKKNGKQILAAIAASAALILADQLVKAGAANLLRGGSGVSLWPGVFELLYVENRGAAFGMLQHQQAFFVVTTVAALLLISWFYLFRLPSERHFLPLNLVCVFLFSGAWGNLIDRLLQGYVVDMFYFKLIDFPVFNLADVYISVSVFCLILLLLFWYRDESF